VTCPVNEEVWPEARFGNDPYHPDLIILVRNGVAKVNDIRRCTFCGECAAACPGLAITIDKQ